MSTRYSTIDLADVTRRLRTFLSQGIRPIPQEIAEACQKLDMPVTWCEVVAWEQKDDDDLLRAVLSEIGGRDRLSGELVVVTEASYSLWEGGFLVDAKELGQLVADHLSEYGEAFFNGDVVILEEKTGQLLLFHHNGCFAILDLSTEIPRGRAHGPIPATQDLR